MPTFPTPHPICVSVELGAGVLRIVASDRTDTVVDVRPSRSGKKSDIAAAEQTRVEYANGLLLIKAPRGRRQYAFWGGGESVDVRIELPAGSELRGGAGVAALHAGGRLGECRYRTGAGDIQVDETGPLTLRTGSGDIGVGHATGHAEITTASGSVQIRGVDGSAVVKNSNGDTWIGRVSGELRVNAANGKIAVDEAGAGVAARTAYGSVLLGEVSRGAVLAQTAYGSLEIGIRAGVPAWLDLRTSYGSVNNHLESGGQPGPSEDSVEVKAVTSYGDITVRRCVGPVVGREAR